MIVYNGGTFDLLHPGHLYVFRQLRVLAGDGEVIIGLNTDEFVAEFKGHAPVQSYLERSEVLAACRYIDRVVPNLGGADSRPVLEAVGPDIIAVGQDWYSSDDSRYCQQMGFTREWLREHHIRLVYMDWLPGHSSTNLRATARAMER
jgi:cytidyltransferase-like protein